MTIYFFRFFCLLMSVKEAPEKWPGDQAQGPEVSYACDLGDRFYFQNIISMSTHCDHNCVYLMEML